MSGTLRERKCLVTGARLPSEKMIRFVLGPDNVIVPDVAAKLPGRGCWIVADKAVVAEAVEGRRFTRFIRQSAPGTVSVTVAEELPDLVERLLKKRCLDYLGLCNRAGHLVSGFEKVRSVLKAGKSRILITAADGAADGRRKLCQGLERSGSDRGSGPGRDKGDEKAHNGGYENRGIEKLRVIDIFSREDLSQALGLENAVHVALLPGGVTNSFLREWTRYAAFLGKMQDE